MVTFHPNEIQQTTVKGGSTYLHGGFTGLRLNDITKEQLQSLRTDFQKELVNTSKRYVEQIWHEFIPCNFETLRRGVFVTIAYVQENKDNHALARSTFSCNPCVVTNVLEITNKLYTYTIKVEVTDCLSGTKFHVKLRCPINETVTRTVVQDGAIVSGDAPELYPASNSGFRLYSIIPDALIGDAFERRDELLQYEL